MSDYALINKDGKVVNVIVADQSFIDKLLSSNEYSYIILREGRKGNINQFYKNNKFYELQEKIEDLSEQIDGIKNIFVISENPVKDFDVVGGKEDIKVELNNTPIDFNYENKNIILNNQPQVGSILKVFYKVMREIV